MCTAIEIDYGRGTVLGRNMDYDVPIDYNILFLPEGFEYAEDLEGNSLKGRYSALGLCFMDRNPLKDGVNEHGLMGLSNLYIGNGRYSSSTVGGKVNISSLDYLNFALTNYRNVAELMDDLDNINVSTRDSHGRKVLCPDFHFYFADNEGGRIILEPRNGVLEAKEPDRRVMTNSPSLETHEGRLQKFQSSRKVIIPAKDLPGGFDPVSRYIRSLYLLKDYPAAEDSLSALTGVYSVLEAMKLPEGFTLTERDHTYTRYVCAYDSARRLLTVRSHRNTRIISLSLEDLKKEKRRISIDVPQELEIEPLTAKDIGTK